MEDPRRLMRPVSDMFLRHLCNLVCPSASDYQAPYSHEQSEDKRLLLDGWQSLAIPTHKLVI